MKSQQYSCARCSATEYETGEIKTTGSGWSGFLIIPNQKYATVICKGCGFTDLYRLDGRGIRDVVDSLTN